MYQEWYKPLLISCEAAHAMLLYNKYNIDYDNDYRMESDLWQAAINIPKGERKTDAGTGGAGIMILDS